jgi:hypothetical protein
MAQPTKNRFIDHLAEGNDAESFFAAGQRNDARATIFARSACTILQAATAKLRFRAGAERHRASIARLRSRRRETDLARGRSVRCSLLNQQAFRLPSEQGCGAAIESRRRSARRASGACSSLAFADLAWVLVLALAAERAKERFLGFAAADLAHLKTPTRYKSSQL